MRKRSPCPLWLLVGACLAHAGPAAAGDFWSVWGDGKAELCGYRLTQPRYGQLRPGLLVHIAVTEDMSDSLRVKADPGRRDKADVYPVLKLNVIRKFQTGIYDYSVMTSVFSRVDAVGGARPFAVRKVSFSSQEWCGHVYHQLLQRGDHIESVSHSYFDGEADAAGRLPSPPGGVLEDELPTLLRSYAGKPDFLREGETRSVRFLPGLLRVRLMRRPLAWGEARITRHSGTTQVKVPMGAFAARRYTVRTGDGAEGTFEFEEAHPHRLVRVRWTDGEEASLAGCTRLSYWQLNREGDESYLKELGLAVPGARRGKD